MKEDNIWDKEAENYQINADTNPDYRAHFAEVEKALGGKLKNKKILDVGSGTGITSAYLAGKGAEMYLVDTSKKALAFQRKYFAARKIRAKFFRQDAFAMKFKKDFFDAVWNGGVIEHFPDGKKIEMIKKMWKLVKPGGILLICVPAASNLPFMLAKKLLQIRGRWAFGYEDDLTENRLRQLANRAGISDISMYRYNPVVGWWFFPFGREITNFLGLNTVTRHRKRSGWGHILMMTAKKTR